MCGSNKHLFRLCSSHDDAQLRYQALKSSFKEFDQNFNHELQSALSILSKARIEIYALLQTTYCLKSG